MRLPEIFDFREMSESQKKFTVDNCPVNLPWFRMSENFATLTENLTETPKYSGKCQKCTGINNICQKCRK